MLRSRAARVRVAAPTYLVGAALAVAWLGLRLFYLEPPIPSDQIQYLQFAADFPGPVDNQGAPHRFLRYGIIAPTKAAMLLFGYSQATYYVVPLLTGMLLVCATYAVGCLLFSRSVGVAAAVLLACGTYVFDNGTELLPDLTAAGLCTAAVAVAAAVRQGRVARQRAALVVVGLLLGWSYLAREFIVFVWPLVPLLLYRRVGLRGLLWMAAPVAVLGLAESALNWAAYGETLARLQAITGHGTFKLKEDAWWQGQSRTEYLAGLPDVLGGPAEGRWLLGLLGAALVGVAVRPRRAWIFAAWIALLWLPLTLLGGLVDPEVPTVNVHLVRYWYPIFPAILLGGLGAVWLLVRALLGRLGAALSAVLAALVVLAAAAVPSGIAATEWAARPAYRANGATQLEQVRTWMGRHGDGVGTVWTDPRTIHLLEVFRNGPFGGRVWANELRRLGENGSPRPGDVVVLYEVRRGGPCVYCGRALREVLGSPPRTPPTWREAYASGDGILEIYRVVGGNPAG
ncbi:MAG: hypothetical protein GEV03_22325 [Streptosporangiales bacterium]|nr:hypothetical protein [Streptosporangiales bacterium]